MRITFYGVQGSGSLYPRSSERESSQKVSDCHLLEAVFADIRRHTGSDGRFAGRIEDILGGEPSRKALQAYREKIRPEPLVSYGGWTTCVHIETAEGIDLVFDCGSGFRICARDLQEKWGDREDRELHIFGTHSHRDHTEGFDQAFVCFDPRNRITIYGNHQFLYALDEYLGIFSRQSEKTNQEIHTPITYLKMPARFSSVLIGEAQKESNEPLAKSAKSIVQPESPIEIGDARITPFELCHPAPCLGYCIESGGRRFVFATDHELYRPGNDAPPSADLELKSEAAEARLIQYSTNADLLYRDGQFLQTEYEGDKGIGQSRAISRRGWGHSCIEDAAKMARQCAVTRTLIGHHDPNREWSERQWIDQSLKRNAATAGHQVELAKAETVIVL